MALTREEVNYLFDATIAYVDSSPRSACREYWIFEQALGDTQDMREALGRFLKDVTTCPDAVVAWCQKRINEPLSLAQVSE